MKLNLMHRLIDIRDGKVLTIDRVDPKTKETTIEEVTFLLLIGEVLCTFLPDEKPSHEEKIKMAKLLTHCYQNKKKCELSLEQLALIETRAATIFGPIVIAAIDKYLNAHND